MLVFSEWLVSSGKPSFRGSLSSNKNHASTFRINAPNKYLLQAMGVPD
jgi:hypothetical protein